MKNSAHSSDAPVSQLLRELFEDPRFTRREMQRLVGLRYYACLKVMWGDPVSQRTEDRIRRLHARVQTIGDGCVVDLRALQEEFPGPQRVQYPHRPWIQ